LALSIFLNTLVSLTLPGNKNGTFEYLASTSSEISLKQNYGGYGNGYSGQSNGGWGHQDDRTLQFGGGLRAVDWANTRLERFEKNFYVEDKRVSARSDREIEEFRRAKEIKVG
jgi:hypothetical protein